VETTFKPISEARNLKFTIDVDPNLPASIETDIQRLNQILKNLLSNAFKFTEKGEVALKVFIADKGRWKPFNTNLDNADRVIGFSITDTGIGIPLEKQSIIFEAFQQAEGSTSRKYGGTGLGLSISRGLAELLGGSIELESRAGMGSTFTLFIPSSFAAVTSPRELPETIKAIQKLQADPDAVGMLSSESPQARNMDLINEMINDTGDDRASVVPNDKVVLVVEDDLRFGKIVIEKAHERGLKAVVATNYLEVFDFINRFSPIAITLDVKLPETSGWKVIELLRSDLNYRHIPIHVISGEENRLLALKRGARSFLLKPLNNDALTELFEDIVTYNEKQDKKVLVVEDNEVDSAEIVKMHEGDHVGVTIASTGKEAVDLVKQEPFDCIILDYKLPDISGSELIHEISKAKKKTTPVIVYSARDFSKAELNTVRQNTNSIITKGANSVEHLLEETISHLHINHKTLSPSKQRIIENIRHNEDILTGKQILVVDDDVRNLFALTTVFERFHIHVITAESGQEVIQMLAENPKIDMVLMDIMMPEMDGYETTQKIRREHKNSTLPIIAVTAKAMKGDRQKCIEAGASDYITKPVKIDQLLSLMRLWLCK
jgi:CheY-like chemotaxis protein